MLPVRLRDADGMVSATFVGLRLTPELAELLHPPSWHDDAACKEHPEVTWFPERGESNEPAKAICRGCLVRAECLTWALAQEQSPAGVWGGLSRRERQRHRAVA